MTAAETATALGVITQQLNIRVDAVRAAVLQGLIPVEYGEYVLGHLNAFVPTAFDPVPVWNITKGGTK